MCSSLTNTDSLGRTSGAGLSLRFFFAVAGFKLREEVLPAGSWVFSSSRDFLNSEPGTRDEEGVTFLRFRGGPIRTTPPLMPAFGVEGEGAMLPASIGPPSSSSSGIVSSPIRL